MLPFELVVRDGGGGCDSCTVTSNCHYPNWRDATTAGTLLGASSNQQPGGPPGREIPVAFAVQTPAAQSTVVPPALLAPRDPRALRVPESFGLPDAFSLRSIRVCFEGRMRLCFCPSCSKWQYSHLVPLEQAPRKKNRQGLHEPSSWSLLPMEYDTGSSVSPELFEHSGLSAAGS